MAYVKPCGTWTINSFGVPSSSGASCTVRYAGIAGGPDRFLGEDGEAYKRAIGARHPAGAGGS
jgi:hypothetical protein